MSEASIRTFDPASPADDGYQFEISGGHPALNLANTISRRADPAAAREDLTHYGRLVSWGVQARLITAREGERLRGEAKERPRAAAATLKQAVAVREAIFSLFSAIAGGQKPTGDALETVNAALPEALAALRVAPDGDGYGWRFAHETTDLAPMLAPVLRAAAELLTSDERLRIRECSSDTCYWLFLDRSKNGTRRWCDMKVCGNRAKARRHYARERSATKPKSKRR